MHELLKIMYIIKNKYAQICKNMFSTIIDGNKKY
jgi:hypothetical protein